MTKNGTKGRHEPAHVAAAVVRALRSTGPLDDLPVPPGDELVIPIDLRGHPSGDVGPDGVH